MGWDRSLNSSVPLGLPRLLIARSLPNTSLNKYAYPFLRKNEWFRSLREEKVSYTSPHKLSNMHYVYILMSLKDHKLYIGCTKDLERRFREHNTGKVESTKNRKPFKLIFYECFVNKSDAFEREQWFKTGFGYNHIRKMLTKTLESFEG